MGVVLLFTLRLRSIRTVLLSIFCLSVCLFAKRVYCDKTKAPSEKSSIVTNRKSPTSFPMSLRWTAYVTPNPKGPQRRQFFSFSIQNIELSSKKVCCKVSLCENFQWQSCKAFTSLSISAQMVGGGVPFDLKYWAKVTHPFKNGDLQSIFARIVTKRDDFL